jgi:hypothetical protein
MVPPFRLVEGWKMDGCSSGSPNNWTHPLFCSLRDKKWLGCCAKVGFVQVYRDQGDTGLFGPEEGIDGVDGAPKPYYSPSAVKAVGLAEYQAERLNVSISDTPGETLLVQHDYTIAAVTCAVCEFYDTPGISRYMGEPDRLVLSCVKWGHAFTYTGKTKLGNPLASPYVLRDYEIYTVARWLQDSLVKSANVAIGLDTSGPHTFLGRDQNGKIWDDPEPSSYRGPGVTDPNTIEKGFDFFKITREAGYPIQKWMEVPEISAR